MPKSRKNEMQGPDAADFERQIDELLKIARLTPVRKDRVLFVGRAGGRLIDNCKHAFLAACRNDYGFSPLFMTRFREEYALLKQAGLPAAMFPADLREIASCAAVVCDDFWWRSEPVYAMLHDRPNFQLWHGIPLKAIGKSEIESAVNMDREKAKYLQSMYSGYDFVLTTSRFAGKEIFSRVFFEGKPVAAGYPRNDVLLRKPDAKDLLGSDPELLGRIRAHKRAGGKVAFFMPTFRDTGGDVFTDSALDPSALNSLCKRHGLMLVLKFHPFVELGVEGSLSNFIVMQSHLDVYPLLAQSDFLITDYSSVYFDYLLTGRPVVFYTYDLEKYLSQDREFMLDFEKFSPGGKARDQAELFAMIERIAETGDDGFADARENLAKLLFENRDAESGRRVCEQIRERLLKL